MKKKKKGRLRRANPPVFVFTAASLRVTQNALKLFEESLQRSKSPSDKIAFSREVMVSVNEKLHLMSTSVALLCLTTFDYNEKIVIATAITQYEVEIMFGQLTAKSQQELRICQQVSQFVQKDMGFQIKLPKQD